MTEKVSLLLDNERFQFWEGLTINLSLDSIDTFSFTTPMDAGKPEFRDNFAPFKYSRVQVRIDDDPLIEGILVNKSTSLTAKDFPLGGYSKPGILKDMPVPPDKYPLELNNQTLSQIAARLAGYYGVKTVFSAASGAPFESVSPEPAEKILEFLIKLAHKRGLLLTNNRKGELVFFVPGKSEVVTPLRQGELPLLDASVNFNEQEMFSSVTGYGASDFGRDPESFTEPVPALKNVNRPFVYTVSDAQGSDLQQTVRFKAGRVFSKAVPVTISALGWRGANNKIWTPGDFISLYAPNIFFYSETRLRIRTVVLKRTASDESAELSVIFPGALSGELPEKMPWE